MQPICTFKQVQIFALTIAGVSLVSILITLFVFNYPGFARTRVIDALLFKNNSDSMARFETTSDLKNLRLVFYVYNITNKDEVENNGAKINLQELGPFVYKEFKTRTFIDNNQTSGHITYLLTKRYTFDQEASYMRMDPTKLNITWLNIPLLSMATTINLMFDEHVVPFRDTIKSDLFNFLDALVLDKGEEAFITDSVHNLLIGGSFRPVFEEIEKVEEQISRKFNLTLKSPLPNGKFGLLYDKSDKPINHTFTSSTGFGLGQTYHDLNQYLAVDGSEELNTWKNDKTSKQCNMVGGTDGEFFSPFLELQRDNKLDIFPIDLCRKVTLKYSTNVTMMGIHTWKYVLDSTTLESGNRNKENDCYCLAKNSDPECKYDGLIDLKTCTGQAGVFASGAHFWAGSGNLTKGFTGDGLTQDHSVHEPTFLIEPITGLALKVWVPFQFNVKLSPYRANLHRNNFQIFEKILNIPEPMFLPFAWVSEASEMTEEQSNLLKKELLIFDTWLITMVLGGSIIMIVAIIVAAVILCLKLKNPNIRVPRETDPLMASVHVRTYT